MSGPQKSSGFCRRPGHASPARPVETPLAISIVPRDRKLMDEFTSQNVRLAYIDAPSATADHGAPILLVHGFASNHAVNWVFPQWVKTLDRSRAARRRLRQSRAWPQREILRTLPPMPCRTKMARRRANLLDHLGIRKAPTSWAIRWGHGSRPSSPRRVPSACAQAVLGGLGAHLVEGGGLPSNLVQAMEPRRRWQARRSDPAPVSRLCRGDEERSRRARRLLAGITHRSRRNGSRENGPPGARRDRHKPTTSPATRAGWHAFSARPGFGSRLRP